MKITKQTPTALTVKTNKNSKLLISGVVVLVVGLLIVFLLRIQPLSQSDLHFARFLSQQQEGEASLELETQNFSTANTGFKLAYYVGRSLFTRERPVVLLALLGIVVGFIILAGPYRNTVATFDKSQHQVTLKQPRWFFRSKIEVYPFHNISEVRVERDRASDKDKQNFGVNLVLSHSEGVPLSRDFVHYKTVFPLSESYRYDYDSAHNVADSISTFMAKI